MGKHLSNEDLINRLYEVDDGDDVHLRECQHCSARWEQLLERRSEVLTPPEVPSELLAAQRREVYRRMDQRRHFAFWPRRFAPALGAFAVVVLGLLLSEPTPEPAIVALNDSDFYTEIYSMLEDTEPDAISPIHGLFEGD